MAYVSQEDKKKLSPAIKAVLKKYGMKASIAVRHHSTLVVNIKSGDLDILGAWKQSALEDNKYDRYDPSDVERLNYRLQATHIDVNTHWIDEAYAPDKKVLDFLNELKTAMEGPEFFNHDDGMTDYFHRSHYVDINVGSWNKPYVCNTTAKTFEPVEVQVYMGIPDTGEPLTIEDEYVSADKDAMADLTHLLISNTIH